MSHPVRYAINEIRDVLVAPSITLAARSSCATPDQYSTGASLILPHMGWNRLLPGAAVQEKPFTSNQYFVHSYVATGVDPEAVMFYGSYGHQLFVAAVHQRSVAGFQFHPERSGLLGLALLTQTCLELLA